MSEAKQSTSPMHWLMAGTLLLIAVFVVASVVIVNSEAGPPVATQTTIGDVDPTIVSQFTSDTAYKGSNDWTGTITDFNSPAGSTTSIHVNGVAQDGNSFTDITTISATAHLSSLTAGCTPDDNNCYQVASCTTQSGSGNTVEYNCQFDMEFWSDGTLALGAADAEDWVFVVNVSDGDGTDGTASVTRDIPSVLAIDNNNSMDFGLRSPGDTTLAADNQDLQIENIGNVQADILVSGTALDCAVNGGTGAIPVSDLQYSLIDADWDTTPGANPATDGVTMTGTGVFANVDLPYRTDDVNPTTDLVHYGLSVPPVEGLCTGTVTMAACASGQPGCL